MKARKNLEDEKMEILLQDLRYGLRMMRSKPLFTLVAVLSLSLGIGLNTAIFSVVNAVVLRPLPYEEPDKLMFLAESRESFGDVSIAYPNFLDWKEQNQVFEHLAVFRRQSYNLTGGSEPLRVQAGQASEGFFAALKVKPILGNTFTPEDDKPGANPVAILSYGLWQRLFAGEQNIVGQAITLNAKPYTIIGVMPKGFAFPPEVELWTPVGQQAAQPGWFDRMNHPGIFAIGRLKQGITIEQARADMATIAAGLAQQYPKENASTNIVVTPYLEKLTRDIRPALLLLFAAVGFVLLIACANVANLMLARAAARQKEIAVRLSLGASRWRIIRQLLTESVMLSVMGGAIGLLLAWWSLELLVAIIPNDTPRLAEIRLDRWVLGFTFLLSFLTGLVFGLVPAWQASKTDLHETLKEAARNLSGGGLRSQKFRSALVIAEIALSLLLLIGSGLMVKSFIHLQEVSPGFNPDNLLTFEVSLPKTQYPEDAQKIAFYKEVVQRIQTLPGVQNAAASSGLPLGNNGNKSFFTVEGQPLPEPGQTPVAEVMVITPDYFLTMGTKFIKGRDFNEQDTTTSQYVTLIDEVFAKRFWPEGDAIGKQLRFGNKLATIAGVVERVKMDGLDTDSNRLQAYFAYTQMTWDRMSITARTKVEPVSLAHAARLQVQAIDNNQPIYNLRTMQQIWDESIAAKRLTMLLFSIFATVALLLATVGIYGVISYTVTQRTHEIGIRLALGAQPANIFKLVVGQGLLLIAGGIIFGLAGAFALTRTMSGILYEVTATDPWTFISISFSLATVAFFACFLPARRATKVDPMVALRDE
jgi:putative ABC transport system permease protein